MDYTGDPSTNQHPNEHDYAQLGTIYSHLDAITTVLSSALRLPAQSARVGAAGNKDDGADDDWGKEVRKSKDGKSSLHERDLGKGQKLFTFVIWADEATQ